MRSSVRVPVVLALVAALAGVPAAPAMADPNRPVVELSTQYICWESDPVLWSTTASPAAPTYQKCDMRVGLSKPVLREVAFTFRTEAGSAKPQSDYVEVRNAKAAIPPGETAGYVTVLIAPDRVREPDETFAVLLLEASGADIGRRMATVTIRDSVQSGD